MNVQLLQKKVEERLNKLSSSDYQNIEPWIIVEAFNKAQLQWVRRQLQGVNQKGTGAEGSTRRIDDLRIILTSVPFPVTNQGIYWEGTIPPDYMEWNRISGYGSDICCPARPLTIFEGTEDNRDVYLIDKVKRPNFEWATTFCTLLSDKVRIYTNEQFTLSDVTLTYYRYPRNIQIAGTPDIYNPPIVSAADVESELPEDVQEILVDECVSIIAGDIQQWEQLQREQQSVITNT